jgi:hypothetical protein
MKSSASKVRGMILLSVALAVVCLFLYPRYTSIPPKEAVFISNFRTHRSEYERLRDMLQADDQLDTVATWGVRTPDSLLVHVPPNGGVSIDRYNEYLALLREVGGTLAFRSPGAHPDCCILVWSWGWAADTGHISICWKENEPRNQVASLDILNSTPEPSGDRRKYYFAQIDEHWYLQEDR